MTPQERREQTIRLARSAPEVRRQIIRSMTWQHVLEMDADYDRWTAESQLEPGHEGWRTWLLMAGRGFGKTRAGSEWVHALASAKPGLRIALVGASIADARTIMVEGVSGLLKVAGNYGRWLQWEPSLGRLTWPNGSTAQLFSGDHADGLRGPEHDVAWFLTFEVFGEEGAVEVADVLRDASGGIVDCGAADRLSGYAAYGRSVKAAIQPLIECYAIDLCDDGFGLVSSPADLRHVDDVELGNSADREQVARVQREQTPARALPSVVRLGYYAHALDYQAGEARASSAECLGTEEQRELPAVLSADEAKSLAHQMIARAWAGRDKLTLRLPPRFLDLRPGSRIDLDLTPRTWTVEQCTIDGLVMVAELRPTWRPNVSVAAYAGRIISDKDVAMANMELALIEVPGLFENSSTAPTVMLAASSPSAVWRSSAVEVLAGGQSFATQTASRKATLGHSMTALAAADPGSLDSINAVEVSLIDEDQWLLSCDDEAMAQGVNLAVLGGEVLQFGVVEPLGEGRFRLRRLLRGRYGTASAVGTHAPGELFALIERDALRAIDLPQWTIGTSVKATARNVSGSVSESPPITIVGPHRETVTSPVGGETVDGEARSSIDQILTALKQHGLIAS